MVGHNERKFDPALPCTLLDRHPSRCHCQDRVRHSSRPRFLQRRWRGNDDAAFQFILMDACRFAQVPQIDPGALVEFAHGNSAAMKINGLGITLQAQQLNQALCFAERIGGNQMAALGEITHAGQEFFRFARGIGVLEDRQPECGFRHENIAGNGFERNGRAIVAPLIIARNNDPQFWAFKKDLRAAKDMAGRIEGDPDTIDADRLAIGQGLIKLGCVGAISLADNADRLRRRQNPRMAGARMVGMPVGDNRIFDRKRGVDIGIDRLYIKIMAQQLHRSDMVGKSLKNKKIPDAGLLADHPLTGWLESRGWSWFPHQLSTLEAASQGEDVLLCAPTGAGKTLSGFLPSFVDLFQRDWKFSGLHTLYISPLKALTVDVHRNIGTPISELGLPLRYETRTGDTPSAKRQRQKDKPPHFLMTTPESLALLLSYPDADKYFSGLRYIVVDELHALMDSKRGDLLSLGLARLATLALGAQRIGLSATIAEPQTALAWISRKGGQVVTAPTRAKPSVEILHAQGRMPWAGHMALYAMPEIYAELQKSRMSIVFVNTRAQAELIFQALWKINEANLKIALHHGSLERDLRRKVEDSMAAGRLDCVVATSSLDLGLDWAEVDLVIQIGAPKGVSRLLQRIGRSNHRMNEPSRALLVPTNRFEYLECLAARTAIAHGEIDGVTPRTGGLDVLAQHIFGTACSAPFVPDTLYREIVSAWPYRNLERGDFDKVVDFVTDGGYVLKTYERFKRLEQGQDGRYSLSDPKLSRQYRMNIGTIVEAPLLKVQMGRKPLGTIEEYFINHLSPGDTFLFAGEIVRFDGLRDMVAMVSRTSSESPKIPSYDGGKLPLSTHLSRRVRSLIENHADPSLPETVRHWLDLQKERSLLPGLDRLVIETFPRGGKFFMVAYTFGGRTANQTLGFLVMRRMDRNGNRPLGFVATDYAVVFWSLRPATKIEGLFDVDLLGEELNEWLDDTPLLKRTFREAAVIAGVIERRHPGQQKSGRQMTFSSDLIYDVLYKYERDHVLLRAARQDANSGLIAIDRLAELLIGIQGKIVVQPLDHISPLAVPMILEIARESISRDKKGDYYLEDLEHSLLEEAGVGAQ